MMTYFLGGMLAGVILMGVFMILDKKYSSISGLTSMTESYIFDDGTYYSQSYYFGGSEEDEDDDYEETEEEADDC